MKQAFSLYFRNSQEKFCDFKNITIKSLENILAQNIVNQHQVIESCSVVHGSEVLELTERMTHFHL